MKPLYAEINLPRDGRDKEARRVRSVRVNLAESPLSWLFARGLLSDAQFAAGEELRADFERAGLTPRVTMNWNAPPIGHRRSIHDAGNETHGRLCAKQRFDAALAHIGPGLSDIAWRVVCAGETVPDAEKGLGWPGRSGRIVLGLALDRLADYYRLR